MNLLEQVCKELGVEIGEKWLGSDGYYYWISESGQIEVLNKDDELLNYGYVYWEDIFTGLLKPVWEPKNYEDYYVPDPVSSIHKNRCDIYRWMGDDYDKWALANRMVYKTQEEAIEAANKMLDSLKGDIKK